MPTMWNDTTGAMETLLERYQRELRTSEKQHTADEKASLMLSDEESAESVRRLKTTTCAELVAA